MSLKTDIKKYKNQLIKKARIKGLWENFGQNKVRKLEEKYNYNGYANQWSDKKELDTKTQIDDFNDWCMNITDKEVLE